MAMPPAPCALRLRQYRLLFRDFGGISGVKVASDAVRDVEQVEVQGATGDAALLWSPSAIQAQPTQTIVWERDGLLLELESEHDRTGPTARDRTFDEMREWCVFRIAYCARYSRNTQYATV